MKNFFSKENLPLLLIFGHLAHISYMIQAGLAVTLPISLILGVLVIFYGAVTYFAHIKKPDAHLELEEKWKEYEKNTIERMVAMENKISAIHMGVSSSIHGNGGVKPVKPSSPFKF